MQAGNGELGEGSPEWEDFIRYLAEIYPDAVMEEPESDDDGPFQSARGARVVAEHGPRLTTFSVPAPGQRAFQYTIEYVNAELDPTRIEEV